MSIASFLLFYKINFNLSMNINWILTFLLMLNVFVMISLVISNPIVESVTNIPLVILLFITVLATPFISIVHKKVNMTKLLANVDLFIILYSISLIFLHIQHPTYFKEHLHVYIFCILIPFISHFTNNKWLETRALILCLFIIFNTFDVRHYGF